MFEGFENVQKSSCIGSKPKTGPDPVIQFVVIKKLLEDVDNPIGKHASLVMKIVQGHRLESVTKALGQPILIKRSSKTQHLHNLGAVVREC